MNKISETFSLLALASFFAMLIAALGFSLGASATPFALSFLGSLLVASLTSTQQDSDPELAVFGFAAY